MGKIGQAANAKALAAWIDDLADSVVEVRGRFAADRRTRYSTLD